MKTDAFTDPQFQRFQFDKFLGGADQNFYARGLCREERDSIYGTRDTRRKLKCGAKLREILLVEK